MKNRLFFRLLILAVATVFTVTSCKDYDDDITRLDKSLSELKSSIPADKSAQIDQLAKDIVTYKGDLDAAKKKLADLEAGKASQEALEAAKKEVLEKAVKVAAFEDYKKGLEENLKKIKEELKGAATQAQIKALEEIYATKEDLSGEVSTLNGLIEAAQGKISAIEGLNLEDHIAKIQANLEEINKLKQDLTNSLPDLSKLKGDIKEEIKGDYDKAIEKAINKLKEEINLEELNKKINSKLNDEQVDKKIKEALDGYKATVEKIYAEKIKTLEENIGMDIEGVVYTSFYHLKSLVFYPEIYYGGIESVVFRPLIVDDKTVEPTNPDECPIENKIECFKEYGDKVIIDLGNNNTRELMVIAPYARAKYNVNPSGLKLEMIDKDNLDVTSHAATFRAGGVEDEVENPFTAKYVDLQNGKLVVDLALDLPKFYKAYGTIPASTNTNRASSDLPWAAYTKDAVLALQVPHSKKAMEMLPEGADSYVTSDYTRIVFEPITGVDIAKRELNTDKYEKKNLLSDNLGVQKKEVVDGVEYTYRSGIPFGEDNAKLQKDGVNEIEFKDGNTQSATPKDIRIIHLVEGEKINLADSIQAVGVTSTSEYPAISLADYGLTWHFDLLDGNGTEKQPGKPIVYKYLDNETDQQQFIKLHNKETGEVEAGVYGDEAHGAAVGRTPIVRVRIMKDDCTVSYAFVKILIIEKPAGENIFDAGVHTAATPTVCDSAVHRMTTEEVNRELYNKVAGGMKHADFIAIYGPESGAKIDVERMGRFTWIKDFKNDQTTYLPQWSVQPCEIKWCEGETKKAITSIVTIVPKNSAYPTLKFTYNAVFTRPSVDLKPNTDLLETYWKDDFSTITLNPSIPESGKDEDPNNFIYESNLSAAFKTFENYAVKFKDDEFVEYEFTFAPKKEQIKSDGDGRKITTAIKAKGKELWAKMDKEVVVKILDDSGKEKDTTLYEAGKEQLIAKIKDHTATSIDDLAPLGADIIEYNRDSLANYLLNKDKEFMWAQLQLTLKCKCDPETQFEDSVQLPVSINGKSSFKAIFKRPINATAASKEGFRDGESKDKSVLDIMKVINISDWFGRKFSENPNLEKFYGVEWARLGTGDILWDEGKGENAVLVKKPAPMHVEWLSRDKVEALDPKLTAVDPAADPLVDDPTKFAKGGLLYYNNQVVVTNDFHLYVPILVKYKWGLITTSVVKIKVTKTEGDSTPAPAPNNK